MTLKLRNWTLAKARCFPKPNQYEVFHKEFNGFNEDSCVKIPALLNLVGLCYIHVSKKVKFRQEETDMFSEYFKKWFGKKSYQIIVLVM